MNAIALLGRVTLPHALSDIVTEGRAAWKASGRAVWERPSRRPWQNADDSPLLAPWLDEATSKFISDTLESFNVLQYDPHAHSLLLFGNVVRHNDVDVLCDDQPAAFFHLILSGSGTLRLPGLRDERSRELDLMPGIAFWFNPRIHHLVKNASSEGLASLTATIRMPGIRESGPA